MVDLPNHVQASLRDLAAQIFQSGYDAGIRAGAEQMRSAILAAAQAPIDARADHSDRLPPTDNRIGEAAPNGGRAPRGSVRAAIIAALREASDGLNEIEVGAAAQRIDPAVSSRSVGGELRRLRHRLYHFDRGRWFLIAQPSDKGTADPEGPAELQPATKEVSHAGKTAIAA